MYSLALLARNGIATAAASDTVLSRTMALAAHQLDNSLEALTNLLYLIRRTLDDHARAEAYLDVAGKGVGRPRGEAAHRSPGSVDGLP
jgi:hypothetical protein